MFGSQILDTAIGIVFVLLLVSILVTTVNELIASIFKSRSKWLRIGIEQLLGPAWTQDFFSHSLIAASSRGKRGPSYVPSRTFAMVVLDLVNGATPVIAKVRTALQGALIAVAPTATVDALKASIRNAMTALDAKSAAVLAIRNDLDTALDGLPAQASLADARNVVNKITEGLSDKYLRQVVADIPNPAVQQSLLALLNDAEQNVEDFKKNIEVWFNNAMDRVGGWYKRKSQYVVLGISLVLTFALNVDSLLILQKLNTQPGVRDSLIAQAKAFSELPSSTRAIAPDAAAAPATTTDDTALKQNFQFVRGQLDELGLPIGWFGSPDPTAKTDPVALKAQSEYRTENALWAPWAIESDFLKTLRFHLLGWLLTAIAASLGAPFWFDMLNKFVSIRSAGKAPEEMPKSPKAVPVPTDPGR